MSQFSILEKEQQSKLRAIFETHSSDGRSLKPTELRRFVADIGLANELFNRDLHYYFPQIQAGKGITYEQLIQFLDYILNYTNEEALTLQAFKSIDRHATGTISSAELLALLKKRLQPREYDLYVQLLGSSYGPLINYIDFFKKQKPPR